MYLVDDRKTGDVTKVANPEAKLPGIVV